MLHGHDTDQAGQQTESADDEREHEPAGVTGGGEDGDTQDHGADVLGGSALEQVSTTSGAVTDVVADQVSDDGGVARVVLGDSGFDLSNQVSADIGGLGVDTAAQLGEQRGEGSTEGVSDRQEQGIHVQVSGVRGHQPPQRPGKRRISRRPPAGSRPPRRCRKRRRRGRRSGAPRSRSAWRRSRS